MLFVLCRALSLLSSGIYLSLKLLVGDVLFPVSFISVLSCSLSYLLYGLDPVWHCDQVVGDDGAAFFGLPLLGNVFDIRRCMSALPLGISGRICYVIMYLLGQFYCHLSHLM